MYDAWNAFANDEPCRRCILKMAPVRFTNFASDLPHFGPPVMDEEENDLAVCDLCFNGATDEETAECEMKPDPNNLQGTLLKEIESTTGAKGETIIAWVLAG